MRLTAIFPVICIGIALILSFLALFAGTNHDMLETYDLLTLNTSRIGYDFFKTHLNPPKPSATPSSSGNVFDQLIHNATAKVDGVTAKIEEKVEQEIQENLDKAYHSLARDLGLKDFYSIHIMDHCEGYFKDNTSARNVTYCSNSTGIADFNITDILQKGLNKTHAPVTLPDLHFPDAINDGIHALKLAFNACFVLYTIGIIFTGVALLLGCLGIFREGRMTVLLNVGSSGAAFFFLMLASIVTTVASTKATKVINDKGKPLNINAARGDNFISLTWATTALMIVATSAWVVELVIGHRKAKMIPKSLQ